jgi:hypothetical protein
MESTDNKGENKKEETAPRNIIHTKTIRAGKRTYFFDVKSTRNNEYYLTITESKRKFSDDGKFYYEKHKVFLYPEDFEKFTDALSEIIGYIDANQPDTSLDSPDVNQQLLAGNEPENQDQEEVTADVEPETAPKNFSNINFDDI